MNFTDPTGLTLELPGGGSFREASLVGAQQLNLMFWRYLFFTPGVGGATSTEGGGVGEPDIPGPRPLDDCQRFANMVQQLANDAANLRGFRDAMARTFTAADNASISEMRRTQNMPARTEFGSGGFKEQFRDPSNQVRHFTGGFLAAAIDPTNGWGAERYMNSREEPNTDGVNDADIALNKVSTDFGSVYGASVHGIEFTRKYLADAIRNVLCE